MKMYFRTLLVALLTLCQAGTAVADSPYIWNGQWAKNLNAKGSIQGTGQPLLYNGQKNYVGNNSGVNASTVGWGVSGASTITGTNNPSFLPGANIGWALSISNGGSAGYARYRFTVDASDYGRVLLIQFDQQTTGGYSAAGSMSLDMYCTSSSTYASGLTRQSLSTDSAGVTKIPGLTGTLRSTFSAASGTPYCELRYTEIVADTSILDVSLVYVGPQSSVQGGYVGSEQSWTPTITGLGTPTSVVGLYSVVGDYIIGKVKGVAGTVSATTLSFSLPNNWTTSDGVTAGVNFKVGDWLRASNSSANSAKNGIIIAATGAPQTTLNFASSDYSTAAAPTTIRLGNSDYSSGETFEWNFRVRIDQLIGSGTVNLAQNDLQYAYNTSTTTANDTTSFGYGPAGMAFQAFAPTGVTPVVKRVQLQYPLPAGSSPYVELFDGTNWVHGVDRLGGTTTVTSTSYGFRLVAVPGSTTQYDVDFYSAYDQGTGDTWSVLASGGWKWRVAGGLPNQTVGFAAYVPGQSSGLVPAVGLPGQTNGVAACSGCVGETVRSTSAALQVTASRAAALSISVPAGNWRLDGQICLSSAPTTRVFVAGNISATSGGTGTTGSTEFTGATANAGSSSVGCAMIPAQIVNLSATTVYYLNAIANIASSAATDNGFIQAQRTN